MTSGPDIQNNLKQAEQLIHQAVDESGAQFVATPEVTDQIIAGRAGRLDESLTQEEHPGIDFFANLAGGLNIWLLIGSMAIKVGERKIANRSFLFNPHGKIVASYDKIHLYDVDLPTGESHRESEIFIPGERAVIADTPMGKIGMSVCYDMRFPHFYRDMAKVGAEILMVPAAFTVPTGQAHWEVLLRARAIECGAFVLAPAQVGDHAGARVTYGHSTIIGPWGEVLAQAEDEPGFIAADLKLDDVAKARASLPSLQHDRKYSL